MSEFPPLADAEILAARGSRAAVDPAQPYAFFAEPEVFDIDRDSRAKLTFGLGSHSCPGFHLARNELVEATRVLLERLPELQLEDEEVAQPRGFALRGSQSLPVSFRPGS